MNKELVEAVSNLQENEAVRLARKMAAQGEDPAVIKESCRAAARIVSDRYDRDEYFLPELVMFTEILKRIGDILESSLAASGAGLDQDKTRQAIGWLKGASQLKQLSWHGKRSSSYVPVAFTRAFEAEVKNKKS